MQSKSTSQTNSFEKLFFVCHLWLRRGSNKTRTRRVASTARPASIPALWRRRRRRGDRRRASSARCRPSSSCTATRPSRSPTASSAPAPSRRPRSSPRPPCRTASRSAPSPPTPCPTPSPTSAPAGGAPPSSKTWTTSISSKRPRPCSESMPLAYVEPSTAPFLFRLRIIRSIDFDWDWPTDHDFGISWICRVEQSAAPDDLKAKRDVHDLESSKKDEDETYESDPSLRRARFFYLSTTTTTTTSILFNRTTILRTVNVGSSLQCLPSGYTLCWTIGPPTRSTILNCFDPLCRSSCSKELFISLVIARQ